MLSVVYVVFMAESVFVVGDILLVDHSDLPVRSLCESFGRSYKDTGDTGNTGNTGNGGVRRVFWQVFIRDWKKESFKRKISPIRCGESGIKVS